METERTNTAEQTALRELWCRWSAVVQRLARRRQRRLSGQEYQVLHEELLRVCRSRAAAADPKDRGYYEELLRLAGPWLSARVLEQADGEVISDLAQRCRRAERQLAGPTLAWFLQGWKWPALALAGAGMVWLAWFGAGVWRALLARGSELARAIYRAVEPPSESWGWIGGGGVAIAIAIWLVLRAARS